MWNDGALRRRAPSLTVALLALSTACRTPPLSDVQHDGIVDLASSDLAGRDLASADFAGQLAPPDGAKLDQQNLGPPVACDAVNAVSVSQRFTVGRSGILTGIEVGVGRSFTTSAAATATLVLSDGSSGVELASATIATGGISTKCFDGLDANGVGPGFFDLSRSAVAVEVGRALRFDLSGNEVSAGMIMLSQGGINGATDYPAGGATLGGVPAPDVDVLFRTFVR